MSEHSSILSIDCCDGRMSRCGNGYGGADGDGWTKCKCPGLTKGEPRVMVYSLSSPGPHVSNEVAINAVTMMEGGFGIRAVRLVTHADCGASKLELRLPVDRALTDAEVTRIEARTAERRAEAVQLLLGVDQFVSCLLRHGMDFKVGHWDLKEQRVIWLLRFDHASQRMVIVSAEASRDDSVPQEATVKGQHIAHP